MDSINAQKTVRRVHVRWMIRDDMREVFAIEGESFEYPLTEDDFIGCLSRRNCIGVVAEHYERIAGYMIYELHRTRLHLLSIAVSKDFRHQQVGTQMLETLTRKLSSQRYTSIALETRETNLAAQPFFRQRGFRAVSVLRDFYDDTSEAAYRMQYRYRPAASELFVPVNRISAMFGDL